MRRARSCRWSSSTSCSPATMRLSSGWRRPDCRRSAVVARDHPSILAIGLVLSVALMGVASTYVARLLDRLFWLAWVGLGIITFVALRMIWDGSAQIMHQTAALSLLGS